MEIKNMPKKLIIFKGYTIDFRLKEFRKLDPKMQVIEFIKFESKKGKKLLDDYNNKN